MYKECLRALLQFDVPFMGISKWIFAEEGEITSINRIFVKRDKIFVIVIMHMITVTGN